MNDKEYIDGNLKVQIAFGLLIVVFAVVFVFVLSTIKEALLTIEILNAENPFLAAKMAGRLLLWIVVSSGVLAAVIGVYLWQLARKIGSEGCYPPEGYPVAVRTRVIRGADCLSVQRMFFGVSILLIAHPIAGLFIWYWVSGGYW